MPKITFILKDGTEKTIDGINGFSVMEMAQKYQIESIEGLCGGSLSCGTCHVYIHPDWVSRTLPEDGISEAEEDMLDLAPDLRPTSRQSCQIILRDDLDGLVVAVPGAAVDW
jgi:2Fe-2S ferredoxin